ncbi:MAG: HDIG domain-containing protein [bacterium]
MGLLERLGLRNSGSELERERSFLERKSGRRRLMDESVRTRLDRAGRWAIGIALLLFASALFPTRQAFKYNLSEGDITSEAIVSPVTFSIQKSEEELERQREDARMSVPPVLELRPDIRSRQVGLLDSLFAILEGLRSSESSDSAAVAAFQQTAPEVSREAIIYLLGAEDPDRTVRVRRTTSNERVARLRTALRDVLNGYFNFGVVRSLPELREISRGTVTIHTGTGERRQTIDSLVGLEQAREAVPEQLRERLPEADDRLIKGGYEIARILLMPNLVLNEERTELRRDEAADNVALTKGTVLQGEEIIGAHKRVTPEVMEKVRSLERTLAETEFQRGWWTVARSWLARIFLIALIMGVYVAFLTYHRPAMLADTRILTTIALVFAAELAIAYLLRQTGAFSTYLVPVAVATMLLTILFDTGVGLVTAFSLGLLLGSVMGFDYPLTLIHTVAGGAGVYAVRRVTRRSHFYRALWVVPLVYLVGISGIEMLKLSSAGALGSSLLYGVGNGMLSVVVTIGLLPLFESLFNFSTDITLLELSDLNHPLLRQLAIRAPGTYHHSLMMGELGAAAAESCGANPLLTRVGAYFHDIGKMNKPEYFVENQSGRNPHTRLSPHMSSLIVASHVKEGMELAEEYRLPDKIRHFIPEHHGTMTMSFFYLKAVEEAEEGGKVSEDDFRYPGPKPQSRETGIIMLADAVEAASRVLQEPSPSRVRGLVGELVDNRLEEGELDECPLTMRDLKAVREAFTSVLTSRFHQRIDYPDRDETLKKAAERDAEARKRIKSAVKQSQEPPRAGDMSLPSDLENRLPAGSAQPPPEQDDP